MARNIHYKKFGQDGSVDVYPFKLKDFMEMTRLCLVHRDKACGTDATIEEKRNNREYQRWYRNYIMLILGCNTGCRIETLLQLTPMHIRGGCVSITEFKTGKKSKYEMNEKVYKVLEKYIEYLGIGEREFIFKTNIKSNTPLTRGQAYKIIKSLANEVGIKYPVGCHSLRKSYGRFAYDISHDIYQVQKMLGHSSPIITQQYICLEEEKIIKARKHSAWGLE